MCYRPRVVSEANLRKEMADSSRKFKVTQTTIFNQAFVVK